MESDTVKKTKEFFYKTVENFGGDTYGLVVHLPAVEKWANYLLKKYPEADKEVVMLSVWLHDIGHYPILKEDHAVTGEKVTRKFLKSIKIDKEKIEKVAQCVRRHRCKDVQPETIEEKMIAFSDSASHMTSPMYLDMTTASEKIERDFRDLPLFPDIKEQLIPLYEAWKKLIAEYEKINKQYS
ncbi:MAG: HD domain-containing protein [Candidatus Staskawiczbacteria bacterium]|nr:HD domain-containing protein [Candidatus Staskawiczbacteria bacterium]